MMKKSLLAGLVLAVLAASVGPAQAAGILVGSAADVVAVDSVCSLREAIANANADADTTGGDCAAGSGADTITFAADYTVTLAGSQLAAVTTAITITGNGPTSTIIQAAAAPNTASHRVFEVGAAGSLTLQQLTVRHGFCGGVTCSTGGGIHNAGTLNVIGSSVASNVASHFGGGIYSQGVLNVTGSRCTDNLAGEGGGGIHNDGGTATVTDSAVSDNTASTDGAGIFNDAGTLIVIRSSVSDNFGSIEGGGIDNGAEGTLTLTSSTVSGNSASFRGGGLFNDGPANVANSTITNNLTQWEGGGIWGGGSGGLTLSRSLVSGNLASGSGGIKGDGSEIYDPNETITADDYNILGHHLLSDAEAFFDFTPGASDRTLTSDGADPTALAAILGPLGDNGGPTFTHALAASSPAIDFAPSADCAAATPVEGLDQRGEMRGVDIPGTGDEGGPNLCDAGAYEAQPPAVAVPISPWAGLAIVLLLTGFGGSRLHRRGRRETRWPRHARARSAMP
jgi:predicted outer membrane repeat protein